MKTAKIKRLENYAVIYNYFTSFFQNGTNPLMKASQKGHISVVELLVSKGAQVISQNNVSHLECRYTHTVFSNKTSAIKSGH